jgi:hypothetical protein
MVDHFAVINGANRGGPERRQASVSAGCWYPRQRACGRVAACQEIDASAVISQDTSPADNCGQLLAQAMLQRVTL